ncbi:MAG: orotidine-5'-phosphate decarboxylase [Candidatus Omnitrophica bacterium]|nr:orotidine-5'-phosphate decarboxylase [Candidatus Omnitrophota bacterium]
MRPAAKVILALDVDNFQRAKYFLDRLYPRIKIFKVGIHLFSACGPRIVKAIHKKGGEVFLDLKFFDIPNSVANAVRQAVRLRVKMLTLHILGGAQMLAVAVKAAKEEAGRLGLKRPLLIGITVLTSRESKPGNVLMLARAGLKCSLDGVVCSAREAQSLRKRLKKRFLIITPGIRPGGCGDDQKRTATVKEALRAGSDFLVIGRPILQAKDPLAQAEGILKEIGAYERRD